MIPGRSTAEKVSFEWSRHRISSTDSKVRTTLITLFFFYLDKNLFKKNAHDEIYQNFKNTLRTYPGRESVKNVFILLIFFCTNKGKRNVKL